MFRIYDLSFLCDSLTIRDFEANESEESKRVYSFANSWVLREDFLNAHVLMSAGAIEV